MWQGVIGSARHIRFEPTTTGSSPLNQSAANDRDIRNFPARGFPDVEWTAIRKHPLLYRQHGYVTKCPCSNMEIRDLSKRKNTTHRLRITLFSISTTKGCNCGMTNYDCIERVEQGMRACEIIPTRAENANLQET